MSSSAKLLWRKSGAFLRHLEQADKKRRKNAEIATRVEAFRLQKTLKEEIKAGNPGGRKFAALREISKRAGRGAMNRTPLKRLAGIVRYLAQRAAGRYTVSVGFIAFRGRLSKSWERIARLHQEGGTVTMKPDTRSYMRLRGGQLKKSQRLKRSARYFFIRKSKQQFRIPARPIIDPFWARHRGNTRQNIIRLWERKMAGERI